MGIAIKKENLAASSFLIPINNAVAIVIPDLDTPGRRVPPVEDGRWGE